MSGRVLLTKPGFYILIATLVVLLSLVINLGRTCQGSDMKLSFGPHVHIGAWPPAGYVNLWADASIWWADERLGFLMGLWVLDLKEQEFPDYFTGRVGVAVRQQWDHNIGLGIEAIAVSMPERWPYPYVRYYVNGGLSKTWQLAGKNVVNGNELVDRFIEVSAQFTGGINWREGRQDFDWLIEFSLSLELCQAWDWDSNEPAL